MNQSNISTTILNLFENVKIYRVDGTDNYVKKFDLAASNGKIEININDSTNEISIKLYSLRDEEAFDSSSALVINCSSGITIYSQLKLSDADLSFLKNSSYQPKRIELKQNNNDSTKKKCGFYYAVEFEKPTDQKLFRETLSYLVEIYNINPVKVTTESEDVEMKEDLSDVVTSKDDDKYKKVNEKIDIKDLCKKLRESIKQGNVNDSQIYVTELAKLKIDIEIIPQIEEIIVDETTEPKIEEKPDKIQEQLSKIDINVKIDNEQQDKHFELFLNASTSTIMNLKEEISKRFDVPAENQLLIINDCTSCETNFISDYYTAFLNSNNKNVTNGDSEMEIYFVHVFINKQNLKKNKSLIEWKCGICEHVNTENICEICSLRNPDADNFELNRLIKKQKQEQLKKNLEENYHELAAYYNQELNENQYPFDCDICLEENVEPNMGVVLKECLHIFCKECLKNHINHSEDPLVKCPYSKEYNCAYNLQEREIRALLSEDEYSKFQMRSLRRSEATMQNTFHCLTPDCIGFGVCEDNLNFFDCPVCEKVNCLRCNVIHMGKTCKEYQDDLKTAAVNDKNAQKDKAALEKLIVQKKAMYCPGCKIIVCKNDGCDWLICAMCKIEICWATRGPRWGPNGHGDTSGGCKCNFGGGKPCTPNCGNCH